jgi:hypothetical protein
MGSAVRCPSSDVGRHELFRPLSTERLVGVVFCRSASGQGTRILDIQLKAGMRSNMAEKITLPARASACAAPRTHASEAVPKVRWCLSPRLSASMMAYVPSEDLVAVTEAPPTIDEMVNAAWEKAAIYFPFADVIASKPCEVFEEHGLNSAVLPS